MVSPSSYGLSLSKAYKIHHKSPHKHYKLSFLDVWVYGGLKECVMKGEEEEKDGGSGGKEGGWKFWSTKRGMS